MVECMDQAKRRESIAAAAEAKRAYHRRWRANNKDKVREYNARYWEKKAAASEGAAGKGGMNEAIHQDL